MAEDAGRQWDWKAPRSRSGLRIPGAPNVEADLVQALVTNPHLHVEVENGLYDLATPFFATEIHHDALRPARNMQKNITLQYYDAGHMMYLHEADLFQTKNQRSRLPRQRHQAIANSRGRDTPVRCALMLMFNFDFNLALD